MPAPRNLVRNLRHPAHNNNACFDDHDVTFLASLYLKLQPLYCSEPRTVVQACYAVYQDVRSQKVGLGVANYDKAKMECQQPFHLPAMGDIADLFRHFGQLDPLLLRPWSEVVAEDVAGKAAKGSAGSLMVLPSIKECLFCPGGTLDVSIRRVSGGGCAKGGHLWAYEYINAGQVAILFKSTCCQCLTDYSLQTYTPGERILAQMGMSASVAIAHVYLCRWQA